MFSKIWGTIVNEPINQSICNQLINFLINRLKKQPTSNVIQVFWPSYVLGRPPKIWFAWSNSADLPGPGIIRAQPALALGGGGGGAPNRFGYWAAAPTTKSKACSACMVGVWGGRGRLPKLSNIFLKILKFFHLIIFQFSLQNQLIRIVQTSWGHSTLFPG